MQTRESQTETLGRDLFAMRCSGCHAGEGFTGPPVALATVGTDAHTGESLDRGTGMYRVPSLRGVATRGALLHDGAAGDVETLFDPARIAADFRGGTRPGAIAGHPFGLDLDAPSRAALVRYVRGL